MQGAGALRVGVVGTRKPWLPSRPDLAGRPRLRMKGGYELRRDRAEEVGRELGIRTPDPWKPSWTRWMRW